MVSHIGLLSRTPRLPVGELNIAAAAIQKQVTRDLGPIWGISATVAAFERLEDVPADYWRVLVDDIEATGDEPGVHSTKDGQPYARVAYSNLWSLAASHEVLEMLIDPFQRALRAGVSVEDGSTRVEYLVEVCDPCQDPACAYTVNDVPVSDFVTQHYFDPTAVTGLRYSFSGSVTEPHGVANGGYLTWRNPVTGQWRQLRVSGGGRRFIDVPVIETADLALRAQVNRASEPAWWRKGLPTGSRSYVRLARRVASAREAHRACARQLEIQMASDRANGLAAKRRQAAKKRERRDR